MSRICLLASFLVAGIFFEAAAQKKLTKQKIDGDVTMKVPVSFIPMNEDDMWQRVASSRKSLALYTDLNRLVELGVNRSYSVWRESDYQLMFDVYKSSILELFDEVEFIREEITTIRKQQFVVFEFVSRIKRDEGSSVPIVKYTYLQYTLHNGQTLVFSFSCPEFQKEEWQKTANLIMESVAVK
jgi:hypothetical protein